MRGAKMPLFFEKNAENCIFFGKYFVIFGLSPSHLATLQYLRTPPVTSLPSVPFPRSYGRKMQPMTVNFLPKSTFFAKKCIFFVKYLVMCIFCCTFAPLFRRRDLRAWQKSEKDPPL